MMMIKKRFLVLAGLSLLIAQSLQAAPLRVAADPLPDSSWRLRSAVGWYRVPQPSFWQSARQEARASLLARASGICC